MFQWSTRSMAQHAVPRIPRSWPPTITTNSRWFNRPQDFAGGMTSFATVLPCTCIILLWVVGQLRFVTTCLGISVSKSMIMISITRYVIYTYIYMCVCLCHTLYITYWMLFVITDMWYTLVVVCLCNILCLLYTKHIHWTYCIFTSFLNNIYIDIYLKTAKPPKRWSLSENSKIQKPRKHQKWCSFSENSKI
jgi:hypothetical protein